MNDVLNIFMYFENRIKDQTTLDKCSVDVIGSDVLGTSLLIRNNEDIEEVSCVKSSEVVFII